MNKTIIICLVTVALCFSCAPRQKAKPAAVSNTSVSSAKSSLPSPKSPRIISSSPSNTEILVDLGFGADLVACDEYSRAIEGVAKNAALIDFTYPDPEKIITLVPDFVFVNEINRADRGDDPYRTVRDTGANVVYVATPTSIAQIYDEIAQIAGVMGVKDRGQAVIGKMKANIAALSTAAPKNRPRVYFEVSMTPAPITFGHGTFLDEMLTLAGGVNVFEKQNRWFTVSSEAVIAANPDVIFTNTLETPDPVAEIKARPGFDNIKAVRENRVYFIDPNSSSRPTPSIVKAIEQMKQCLEKQ
jgi:iron complex transport system substrate-binding protein